MTLSTLSISVSAPANLLLMGEYAVLEEGGLGLAIAPDIRVTGTTGKPAGHGISVVGHLPGAAIEWPGDTGLLGLTADYLSHRYPAGDTNARIELESTAFFTSEGRKRGLGSSAAVAVALTAFWLRITGRLPDNPDDARALIFSTALDAHRAGQGGEGSGYDVACSTFGGVILFAGGRRPAARRIALPWLPEVRLIPGAAPVPTVGAVRKYRGWKAAAPQDAPAYVDESNRLVMAFTDASDWNGAAAVLREYRDLVVHLGDSIGVPSVMETPAWVRGDDAVIKAVGAGNELGVVLGGRSSLDGEDPITVSDEGVTWA